jgi:hypothetical protein
MANTFEHDCRAVLKSPAHQAAVIVHGHADMLRALQAGRPLILLSAPGAAIYGGALWWRALAGLARQTAPDLIAADILDCADAAGRAREALDAGCRWLVLSSASPGFASVAAVAATLGARLSEAAPPALDMASRGAERRLADWLK